MNTSEVFMNSKGLKEKMEEVKWEFTLVSGGCDVQKSSVVIYYVTPG